MTAASAGKGQWDGKSLLKGQADFSQSRKAKTKTKTNEKNIDICVDEQSFTNDGSYIPKRLRGKVWNVGENWMLESYWIMSILLRS